MTKSFLTKIHPHLLSDEFIIQEYVLHALKEYPGMPSEWTNQVLKKALQSEKDRIKILVWLREDAVNEASIPLLIELIKVIDPKRKHLVMKYMMALQPEWVVRHEDELAPYLGDELLDFNRFLLEGEEDDLWEKYYSVLATMERMGIYDHQLFLKARKLLDVLVGKGFYTETDIVEILKREEERPFFSFDGIFAVRAVGLLKLELYIRRLVKLLRRDEDSLLEEVAEALIGFQSNDVAEAVAPFALEDEPQIYAINILSNTKTDRAVQILVDCYSSVDEEGKGMVIEALTHHFSEEAFPLIDNYLARGYESGLLDMNQIFYSFYTIMGKKHLEMERWKEEFEISEMQFDQSFSRQEPSIREEKIGRNEKCPCGSGKKYKKCCGR